MTATFDHVVPDATPSVVTCPWRFVSGQLPDNEQQTSWWSRLTGQTLEDAAEAWIESIHSDDREAVRAAWNRALEGEEPYLAVFRVMSKEGDTHLLLAYGLPVHDDPQTAPAWSGQIIDITLYQRSTKYAESISTLLGLLSEGRSAQDILEIVRRVVQGACQADAVAVLRPVRVGINVEEETGLPGVSVSTLLGLITNNAEQRKLSRADRRGSFAGENETCQITATLPGFQSVISAPIPGPDQRAGALIVAFRDATPITSVDCDFVETVAMHTAQALQMTHALDAEREARSASDWAHRHLDLVANVAPALIAYLDRDLRLQFCNTAFSEWFGLSSQPQPGAAIDDIFERPVIDQVAGPLQRALAGESSAVSITIDGLAGTPREVELTIKPSRSESGDIQGLVILGFDVSDRQRAIERSQLLTEFSAALSRAASHDEVVEIIVQHAAKVFGATSIAIVLAAAGQALVWSGPWDDAAWHLEHVALPPEASTWWVMEHNRPTIVSVPNDSDASPVLDLLPDATVPGIRVLLPLVVSFEPTGLLVISLPQGSHPSHSDLGHLQLTAGICAGALDRARLHDSLSERESRFRQLADALPQIVWVSSGDGSRLEFLNRRWEEYTGVSIADVSATDISLLTHPEDRDQEHQRWVRSLQTGELYESEVRLRRGDGSYSWFLNRGVPVRNAAGNVESWFGTMTNIDTHRTSLTHQAVISTLDTQIRLLSDPAQIVQTLVTTVGRHLHVDRCFLTEVLDVENSESPSGDLVPNIAVRALWVAGDPDNIESIRELAPALSRQFASELRPGLVIAIHDLEEDAPTEEAKEIAAQLGVRAIIIVPFLRAGRWVAGITVHSLTPRKWTAAELAIVESAVKRTWPLVERSRAVEALAESENRLRQAAEAANFSNFDFDPRSGTGYWSEDTSRVFRRLESAEPAPSSVEELVGMVHPDDRQRLRDLIAGVSEPGASNVVIGEFRHLTDDGETCWFLLRGSVEFSGADDARVAERIRGVLMDITPRKREEEERLVALDAAAHDLKNPVATIRALAQVGMRMEERRELPEEQMTELLKSIEGATDRLTAIIGDFLDTAHLRAGRALPLQRKMIDLYALLAERVDEWRDANPDREFAERFVGNSIVGCWDESRLRRVFDNLIGNAVKFSPNGDRIDVSLDIQSASGKDEAVVAIADNGIGIASIDLARVQETFERGSNVPDSIPGSGVGLIAARMITSQHGGSLDLASVEGKSTTVTIRLPIETCDDIEK